MTTLHLYTQIITKKMAINYIFFKITKLPIKILCPVFKTKEYLIFSLHVGLFFMLVLSSDEFFQQ